MIRNIAILSQRLHHISLLHKTQPIGGHGFSCTDKIFHRNQCSLVVPSSIGPTIVQDSAQSNSSDDIADEDCIPTQVYNERKQSHLLKNPSKELLLKTIRQKLDCNEAQAFRVYSSHSDMRQENVKNVMQIIDYLFENNVTGQSILENPWLLVNNYKSIKIKLPLIQLTKPVDINDLVPLMRATPSRLNKIYRLTKMEESFLPGRHRVYYISQKLGVCDCCSICGFILHKILCSCRLNQRLCPSTFRHICSCFT